MTQRYTKTPFCLPRASFPGHHEAAAGQQKQPEEWWDGAHYLLLENSQWNPYHKAEGNGFSTQVLPSSTFLQLHWIRSAPEMRLSHNLCIAAGYDTHQMVRISPETLHTRLTLTFLLHSLRRLFKWFEEWAWQNSYTLCLSSSLFDALQQIGDTRAELEAGHGSLMAAERWYLCSSEKFLGFGCYNRRWAITMSQCTAKLQEKILLTDLKIWSICSRMSPAGRLSRSWCTLI